MFRRVLLLGIDERVREGWGSSLRSRGFGAVWCERGVDALGVIDDDDIDVIVMRHQGEALDVCRSIAKHRPNVRVVVLGPETSFDALLEVVRAGAFDYLTEPFQLSDLLDTLTRAVRHAELRVELEDTEAAESLRFEGLIGRSEIMVRLYDTIERAAETDVTVLLTGESGTGKELIARALHKRSARRGGPFVAVNCSALPPALLESELFGHVKGAFTDARGPRAGLFVAAGSGTIFLDEIGDMPLALQPKLLRALQERVVRPVGSDTEVPFDVRIVAATHRDLREAIADRRFREDLFYRIDVVHIDVPPLRMRDNDIVPLAGHYVRRYARQMGKSVASISRDAIAQLMAYDWPGNVRELQNCIERAVALTHHDELQVADLPATVRPTAIPRRERKPSRPLESLHEVERRHILRVLAAVDGNRREAARILEVDRKTLYRRLRRYGVSFDRTAAPDLLG